MRAFAIIALSLAAGCGGDDDGSVAVDARAVDAPVVCGISSTDFGDLGERTGIATMQNAPDNGLATLIVPLTAGSPNDRLVFQLWGRPGAPITAGTYEITGPQTAVPSCSVCVAIGARWAQGSQLNQDHLYLATGGTALVSQVSPFPGGVLEVDLTGLTFQHVRITNGASAPVNDGCVSAVGRLSYRGNFEGGAGLQRRLR